VKALATVVLLAGCDFQAGVMTPASPDASDASAAPDAAPDAPVILPDARMCFGTLVNVCFQSLPIAAVRFEGAVPPIDTGVDASCTRIVTQTGGPSLCVIAGTSVTVSGSLVATGPRPLVLIGIETVNVPGILDVSSTAAGRRGAGAGSGGCAMMSINGRDDAGGGGGGAGGSLGTPGGKGGTGDTNDNGLPNGQAIGGTAGLAQPTPVVLRGGCNGGQGGDSDAMHRGGAGGLGGGAVYLIAGGALTVPGDVFASGAGGGANPTAGGIETGGGGGGAGGMIVLEAAAIDVSGRLVANGGGGGGGGSIINGGMPGGDGTTTSWDTRASGGAPAGPADGPGGPGTALGLTSNLDGDPGDGGAGGGGGGLGLVWIYGPLQNGTRISPTPVKR
jgi:hypothetical protein